VTSADVGAVSLMRMIRAGFVAPLSPGFAAPLDLPITRADRAISLGDSIPSHTIVSGLGGLWIHVGGRRPPSLDLVGERGLHRSPPGTHPPGWTVRFHSGDAAIEPSVSIEGLRVASLARCVVDGLRWGDLAQAIPAAIETIRAGAIERGTVSDLVHLSSSRGLGTARLRSAWAAIDQTLH